jgi:hypothetical protein
VAARSRKTDSPANPPSKDAPPKVSKPLLGRALRWLWRPLPLLTMSLVLSGMMFWPQLLRLVPDLSNRPEYQIGWSDVAVTQPGRWVPLDLLEQVRTQSGRPAELSLLDDGLVRQIADAFVRHPWVESVTSVIKQPHGVQVELVYRQPVLMVRTSRGVYPVDARGVLLPPADFSVTDVDQFPQVLHVRTMPEGPAGTSWGDEAVAGAARLAARLTAGSDHETPWKRYGLQAIVVRSKQGPVANVEDIIYGLTTAEGSQIVWGHAPGADALEPTIEQKLERLDRFLTDNGRFDHLDKPILIDITDWELIRWDLLSRVPGERVFR